MEPHGLRERKKAATRRHIAATAARLFAEHGYEQVSVGDVARAADVAEQTVYNHFGTKERLVVDRDEQIRDRLVQLIRDRPPGTTPAAAVRGFVLESAAAIRAVPADQWRGELGHLAAISPAVHRLALELLARQAEALAEAIAATSDVAPATARLQGIALSGVFQVIIADAGRGTVDGWSQGRIADELSLVVATMLDDLDRWFSVG